MNVRTKLAGAGNPTVLFIEPPFYRLFEDSYSLPLYPLALGYLGGTVERHTDWNVKTYNADFRLKGTQIELSHLVGQGYRSYLENLRSPHGKVWQEVERHISECQPQVVGLTSKSQSYGSAKIVARIAKRVSPHSTVVLGGPHASMVGAEVLGCPDIDVAVRGEGEAIMVEILRAFERGEPLTGIPGTVSRWNGRVVEASRRPMLEDLDDLCFPHESAPRILLDYELYPTAAFGRIFTTRGCPFECFFCGSRQVWSRRVRHRSIASVVAEVEILRARGITEIRFDDDTFGVSKARIREMCEAMQSHFPGLPWVCEMHVNLVCDEIMRMMKRSGCRRVELGVESGNNEILRLNRKGYTIEKALEACRIIRRNGLSLYTFFMVGFPQDTRDSILATLQAMKDADCDGICYSIFTPYPGTEAFEYCLKKGMIEPDFDVSLYNHQSPANHFCANLSHPEFRKLASKVERFVERHRCWKAVRRRISFETLTKVRSFGVRGVWERIIGPTG